MVELCGKKKNLVVKLANLGTYSFGFIHVDKIGLLIILKFINVMDSL